MLPVLPALLLLAACAVPRLDVPNDAAIARADYPRLIPSDRIAARADAQAVQISPAVTAGIRERAGDLQRRAAGQPDALAPAASGTLRARAADLRRRATLMRQSALTDADRERLRMAPLRLRERTATR